MPDRPGRQFLQVPGPTNIPDRILRAMHRPALDFSSPGFMDIGVECLERIKPLFGTSSEVFFYTASGHGAWEAAFANLFEAGDTILMPETGRFSKTWGEMAAELGLSVETIPNDWRSAIDPDQVEELLRQDKAHNIKAVLAVHVETATGVLSQVAPIRKAIDNAGHPALLVVDAIASFMTMPLPMDELGVDVVIAACQKGLMMPPGLSFNAVSDKAIEASRACRTHRNYWSWIDRMGREQYHRFAGTAPEHLFFALQESITMINEWGMEAIFARHARLADAVRLCVSRWTEAGALEFNAVHPEQRANALTVIRAGDGVDPDAVRFTAREMFDVAVGGGLGQVAGKVFRIGHMGDLNDPMILGALAGIEATLARLDIPYESGLADAVQFLSRTAAAPERQPDGRRVV
ncbi:MAG: pyridoxal-phosphate-dependent aminotransferase family protein [Minwuia sp.]|uniref:pyridoxal-phosphate-dependent aminotransferase family protein n=1 Tax=Minwuia sp. TaxID=2493630 RepID=UPI003A86A090